MEEALIAGAEGDASKARKKAEKARNLIGSEDLGRMVSAQAAEACGDSEEAGSAVLRSSFYPQATYRARLNMPAEPMARIRMRVGLLIFCFKRRSLIISGAKRLRL